jgi:uncharacterized protein YuzE
MTIPIDYDPEADILLVKLREGKVADEQLLDNDIVVGLDEEGNILYLEIWSASRRGLLKALAKLAKTRKPKLEALLEGKAAP